MPFPTHLISRAILKIQITSPIFSIFTKKMATFPPARRPNDDDSDDSTVNSQQQPGYSYVLLSATI